MAKVLTFPGEVKRELSITFDVSLVNQETTVRCMLEHPLKRSESHSKAFLRESNT